MNETEDFSQEEYSEKFEEPKKGKALEHALDIRKFEIGLYWKRATYFWAFIGATFAGYGLIQVSNLQKHSDLSVIFACLGVLFSFAWFCVNRGSKHWQENWESHVDMLEDDVIGPLYKVVFRRHKPKGFRKRFSHLITGSSPLSVSRINQIISLYVFLIWIILLYKSLPKFDRKAAINWEYVVVIGVTVLFCIAILVLGRTYVGTYKHHAKKRKPEIDNSA
jgi:hypothetical protein